MKILLIDNWSKGLKFYESIIIEIEKKLKCEIFFIHADSIYNRKSKIKKLSNIKIFDLSEFDYSFHKICKFIRPYCAIFISSHYLFHQWANEIFYKNNIICYHFMHGMRFKTTKQKLNKYFFLFKRLNLYLLQAKYVLDDFKYTNMRFKLKILFIIIFSIVFFKKNKINPPVKSFGLNYKKIFLNFYDDKKYYKVFLGNQKHSIQTYVVSGNVNSNISNIKLKEFLVNKSKNFLFISQPLYISNLVSISTYVDDLCFIKDELQKKGWNMLIRPHPSDTENFFKISKLKGLKFSNNIDLRQDILTSYAVIGLNSAALIGPLKLGLRVLLIKLDFVNTLPAYMTKKSLSINTNLNNLRENIDLLVQKNCNFSDLKIPEKSPTEIIVNSIIDDLNRNNFKHNIT